MTKKEKQLARIFESIASLLEIKGETEFKSRAYRSAAEIIRSSAHNFEQLASEGRVESVDGFGKALAAKTEEFFASGRIEFFEKLTREVPITLLDVVKISGLGTKRARTLWLAAGVTSLDDLEKAVKDGRVEAAKGFGKKFAEQISNSLAHRKASAGRYSRQNAFEMARETLSALRQLPGVLSAEFTGESRRFAETQSDLRFIVSSESPAESCELVRDRFAEITQSEGTDGPQMPVIIEISRPDEFVWRLHQTTSARDYALAFAEYAAGKGFAESGNSLVCQSGEIATFSSEAELYTALGLELVAPELRESPEYIHKAARGELPRLVENHDLRGMLHVHSNYSDGTNSMREMALAAKDLGFEYIAICDHSKSASYAGGLSEQRVLEQHEEMDRLNAEGLGIFILKGIETDILMDGSLDYSDDFLALFDLVVASVHSGFKMAERDMTRRLINALENPHVDILGHPTGRLLLAREEYPVNIAEVIRAAADLGKVIEINANPYRLDLSWRNAEYAKSLGMKLAINPDSHKTETLSDVYYGVSVARKAGLETGDIVNCLSLADFRKLFGIK